MSQLFSGQDNGLNIDSIPALMGPWYPPTYFYRFYSLTGNDTYLFLGTSHGVYRKKPADNSWTKVYSGTPLNSITSIVCKGAELIVTSQAANIYAQFSGPVTIYKSIDNGASWHTKLTLPFCVVNELKNIDNTFYLATSGTGLYFSIDDGETWSQKSTGSFNNIYSIEKHNNEIFIATDSGIFKNLEQLINFNNNIVCSTIYKIVKTDSSIATVSNSDNYFYYGSSLNISTDDGNSWNNITSGLVNTYCDITPVNNSYLISAIVYDSSSSKFYLSDFNGNNWNLNSNLQTSIGGVYSLTSDGHKIIVAEDYYMYISSDSGLTWTDISFNNQNACGYSSELISGNDIYFSGWCSGQLYKSLDNGSSWIAFRSGLQDDLIHSLGEFNGILFAGGEYNCYIRHPDDTKWSICENLPGQDSIITSFASDDNNIYACTTGRVYYSSDSGLNWKSISGGLPMMCNLSYSGGCLMEKNGYLYYGTPGLGVWRTSTSNLPFDFSIPDNPSFVLDSGIIVFPNPATNELFITPNIKSSTIQSLDVINMEGQIVLSVKGPLAINISGITRGLYIVRVVTARKNYYGKFVKD